MGVLPEAAPYVAYAPIDLDGQVGTVVDVPPEVYELVRLVVHLARCVYAEYFVVGSGQGQSRRRCVCVCVPGLFYINRSGLNHTR